MKLNCLIIDDEPLARKGMEEYVRELDYLTLVAKCDTATKAMAYLQEGTIDLVFIDIQMPRISGIEFLKKLTNPPMAIITTAFPEYALEGYSLNIIDYLVKPISFERFQKAAHKAREFHELKHDPEIQRRPRPDYFFIKSDGKYEKVHFAAISHVEAMQNYVIVHINDRKLIAYMTLSSMESQLPADDFMRVHKSFVVSVHKVSSIDGNDLILNGVRVPMSRALKEEVVRRILGGNLLSR